MSIYNAAMEREEFLDEAGGVLTGFSLGSYAAETELVRYYWQFFEQKKFRQRVKAIYSDITVDVLLKQKKYSIEHVIPKSFLYTRLKEKGYTHSSIRGALMNPFNFATSHRRINSIRSSFPFDMEDDRTRITFNNPSAVQSEVFGFDHENEWGIPLRSRGQVARAVLHMTHLYALPTHPLDIYYEWSEQHPPQDWERAFNSWIKRKYRIRNPFLKHSSQV